MRSRSTPAGPPPTLGGLLDAGDRVSVHCGARGCGHQAELDLAGLAAARGRGFDLGQVRARLRCSSCGALGTADTIVSPAATQFSYGYPRT